MDPDNESLPAIVTRVTEALGEQAELHIELIKAQLTRDATSLGRAAVPAALGISLLGLGYIFACVAAALGIGTWIGMPGGVALIAVVNVLVGGSAVRVGWTRWQDRPGILLHTGAPDAR